MFIWVTADDKKMPVLMETRLAIGSIAAKLTGYDLGGAGSRQEGDDDRR